MKNESTLKKILTVIRVLFGTAARKYPSFFVQESLKTLTSVAQPLAGLIITPLLVDELCGEKNVERMILLIGLLIGIEAVLFLLYYRLDANLNKYQERLQNYFAMEISMHTMKLDFQLTEDKQALDQLEKARTGMDWYSGGAYGIAEQVFSFIGNILKTAEYVTVIAIHAPLILAVVAIYAIINGLVIGLVMNKVEIEAFKRLSKFNRLFGYFGFNMTDFRYGKDIRLYDAKDMMVEKWEKINADSMKTWKWQGNKASMYCLISLAAGLLRTFAVWYYAGSLAIRHIISIGTLTQMGEAAGGLDGSLSGLLRTATELIKRCNYAYEYVLFMNYPEALPKGNIPVNSGLHRIEFRNVSFSYPGTEKLILNGINLTVEPGEHLSVVGLNGAGKTTFIKLLCRLYDPTEGTILVDGRDIREYDYDMYTAQFAPVFQDFKMFGFTVAENITLQEDGEADPADVIRKANLDEAIQKMPHGASTQIFRYFADDGVEPSGGEQQKMAIARALYKDAPVVILDEPTAALDPIAEYEIYKEFNTLVGGKTAFYISHRLSSCRFCDRIAVFSEGKVAEYGTHDELVKLPDGIYAEMFEAQAQYYR